MLEKGNWLRESDGLGQVPLPAAVCVPCTESTTWDQEVVRQGRQLSSFEPNLKNSRGAAFPHMRLCSSETGPAAPTPGRLCVPCVLCVPVCPVWPRVPRVAPCVLCGPVCPVWPVWPRVSRVAPCALRPTHQLPEPLSVRRPGPLLRDRENK